MKLTAQQSAFQDVAIVRDGIFLLSAADSISFINVCESDGVPVLGVEAFAVSNEYIQPYLEHSIDLYGDYSNCYNLLRDFISSRSSLGLFFDVGVESQ